MIFASSLDASSCSAVSENASTIPSRTALTAVSNPISRAPINSDPSAAHTVETTRKATSPTRLLTLQLRYLQYPMNDTWWRGTPASPTRSHRITVTAVFFPAIQ